MVRSILTFLAAALVTVASTTAQVATGDIVLTASANGPGAFAIDPDTGAETTIRSGFSMRGAEIAHGNDNLVAIGALSGEAYRFTRAGSYTTLTSLNAGLATAIALDQDASMLLVQSWARQLTRIHNNGATSTLTTFSAGHGAATSICRDGDTGHFIVGFSTGRLLRVHRETGSQTTVATGLTAVEGVAYLPVNGMFIVACQAGLRFVKRNGVVAQTINLSDLGAVAVDPRTCNIYTVQRTGGKLYTASPIGLLFKTQNVAARTYHGIAVWGSRIVSVNTTGGGSAVSVSLKFPRSKRRTYCAALSFGNHLGIPVGNEGRINLAPDALFFLTVCGNLPSATSKFLGKTNIAGGASASFQLPKLPSGTVIYVGAVAVNPTLPGGFDFMNTEGVRVE